MTQERRAAPLLMDLDGTLVDSAPGIVASLHHALAVCGIEPPAKDLTQFIGPPLPKMLELAMPDLMAEQRDAVIAAYREHYGVVGLLKTVCYPGVPEVLAAIAEAGRSIYVVTNKPQQPADAIIGHLGLEAYVHRVVGGDPTGRVSKSERAAVLARENGLAGGFFLGDGLDDLVAAERIGAAFYLAGWGYGSAGVLTERPETRVLTEPASLLAVPGVL